MVLRRELERVLSRDRTKKLAYLHQLSPADAYAVELIIDDCLIRHWPKTVQDWWAVSSRLGRITDAVVMMSGALVCWV